MARKKKSVKTKSAKKSVSKSDAKSAEATERIVIDADKNLIFDSESELFAYFAEPLAKLEQEFEKNHNNKSDITTEEFDQYENMLVEVLSSPDEIWQDDEKLPSVPLKIFVKRFVNEKEDKAIDYVALVYMAVDTPTFVFLHFPTRDESLVDYYRKGDLVYDREMAEQAEGDALSAGDELAVGLYEAMIKIRSDKDIPTEDFISFIDFREDCIQEPDEIWRTTDLSGNVLVNFIKDYSEADDVLYYIAVAKEDKGSDSHYLLFAFPTNDRNLVDRYRQGENLQSEESPSGESH